MGVDGDMEERDLSVPVGPTIAVFLQRPIAPPGV